MDRRFSVLWEPITLAISAVLLVLSTVFLRSAVCVEGGTVLGFPRYFYTQCYASMPGGPLGPAEFSIVGLILDAATWYLLAVGIVLLARRGKRSLAFGARPE